MNNLEDGSNAKSQTMELEIQSHGVQTYLSAMVELEKSEAHKLMDSPGRGTT